MDESTLITKRYFQEKRAQLQAQIDSWTGALEILNAMEAELFPPEPMTIPELEQATGLTIQDHLSPREV